MTSTSTSAVAVSGCSVADLRAASSILARGVARRAPREGIACELADGRLHLRAHDGSVDVRVSLPMGTGATDTQGTTLGADAPEVDAVRCVVGMRRLKSAVAELAAGGEGGSRGRRCGGENRVLAQVGENHLVLAAGNVAERVPAQTVDQLYGEVPSGAPCEVIGEASSSRGAERGDGLREVLTMPAGDLAVHLRALAVTTTTTTAVVDASMRPMPLYGINIVLPDDAPIYLASTDAHRYTRWQSTFSWLHAATNIVVPADDLTAATRVLSRVDRTAPLTLSIASGRVQLRASLARVAPDAGSAHRAAGGGLTASITIAAASSRDFPHLRLESVTGPRCVSLARSCAARLSRLAREAVARGGAEARIVLRHDRGILTVLDSAGVELGQVPVTTNATNTASGSGAWEVTFAASYLAQTLTTLHGPVTMTSAAPSDGGDARLLAWAFSSTDALSVVLAPVSPAVRHQP
ncbi:hypothetical protein [Kineococcus rhizosphaerae]|uniref:DNA polymerase-3 subunit beta n=1 Tax=Kineococcus rhizosphaerae TaxID=559628 RepID=A0A2T0QMJ2_9ACTN|nr:hypothetical protein [Kineococcus rhizosphaerae]PRY05742.1 hypothetical protein CLV37_1373 [Kineococcus rhizosphaerae]